MNPEEQGLKHDITHRRQLAVHRLRDESRRTRIETGVVFLSWGGVPQVSEMNPEEQGLKLILKATTPTGSASSQR